MSSDSDHCRVSDGWTILRSGVHPSGGFEITTMPTHVTSLNGPVRLALGSSGQARLLLPLANGEVATSVVGAPALQVEVSTYSANGKPQRFLDLTCLTAELETVFHEVADHILLRVAEGAGCVDAARSTIEEFRALLLRPRSSEVPGSQVAGLVGELLFLRRLTERSAHAWKSWRGPAGDRHDFARGSTAVEVKVTTRKGKSEVSINGIEQLAEPAGGELYLLHYEIETVASGILSVSALGRSVLAEASEPERVRELLAAIGCTDVDADAWNEKSFRLENETLYRVERGFPRLIQSSLAGAAVPEGISNVCYVTDLAAASAFRIDPSLVEEIEGKLLP